MKSYSAERMRGLDRRTIDEYGIPGVTLMENAGSAVTRAAIRLSAAVSEPEFVILAGKGNNGGDAYVVARQLFERHCPIRLFMAARPDELSGDAAEMFEAMPAELRNAALFDFQPDDLNEHAVVIDGLLGTGMRGEVREPFASWIRFVNGSGAPVLAIDIPSGLNADDGSASVCIRADLTVTMAGVKTGMLTGKGPAACGRVEVARIGIPDEYLEEAADGVSVFTAFDARALLRREPFDTFKNQRGHLAVIGGSRNYASAPFLAAETALRSGSGLVTVLLPETAEIHCVVRKALIVRRLETGGLPAFSAASVPELEEELENKSALAVGPGMMHRPE
ncbi:MAG: NAD(P)H-hydrate epimerase, partial [bacterium]|nr:NAD(P)H-hydrate epimerase [bacterium]